MFLERSFVRTTRGTHPSLGTAICRVESALAVAWTLTRVSTCTADLVSVTYTGASGGVWGQASNWSPALVPNNGANTFDVTVNGSPSTPVQVLVDWTYAINSLAVNEGDQVTFQTGARLTFAGSPLVNNGVVSIIGSGTGTQMRVGTPVLEVLGSGTLSLSSGAIVQNNFDGIRTLVNGKEHTIRGTGHLGYATLRLTNFGLIQGDLPTPLELVLDEFGTSFNEGVMQAVNGGWLHIAQCGTIDNTDGLLLAKDGSTLSVDSTTVVGGELATEGTGVIKPLDTPPPTFVDLLINGHVLMLDRSAHFGGTITNQGHLEVFSAEYRVASPVSLLTGGGSLTMSNATSNAVRNAYGSINRLIHDAGHTIRGSGKIGADSLYLTNYGLIRADQPTPLVIDLYAGSTNYNAGVIEAVNGATLNLSNSGVFDNTGGVLRAGNGSTMVIEGTNVIHGELATEGTGTITPWVSAPTFTDLLINGHISVGYNKSAAFKGTVTNHGLIELAAAQSNAEFRVASPELLLTGDGTLLMGNYINNVVRNNYGAVNQFTNAAGHTIHGAGRIGANTLGIVNDGLIVADLSAGLTIDPNDSKSFVNNGTLRVAAPGALSLASGPFANFGRVVVDQGRSLTRAGDFTQNAGSTLVDGTLAVSGGSLKLAGGTLEGAGLVVGPVANTGGKVSPGPSTAQLQIQGSYTQSSAGALSVELGSASPGTPNDLLKVNGAAVLGGTLEVAFAGGVVPPIGSQFTVLSASSVQGQFLNDLACSGLQVSYTPTSVVLTVVFVPEPADLDCDGDVDATDLDILLSNWGRCNRYPCTGDLNSDGIVDGEDLGMLLGSWKRNRSA